MQISTNRPANVTHARPAGASAVARWGRDAWDAWRDWLTLLGVAARSVRHPVFDPLAPHDFVGGPWAFPPPDSIDSPDPRGVSVDRTRRSGVGGRD